MKQRQLVFRQLLNANIAGVFVLLFLFTTGIASAQTQLIDKKSFFKDDQVIQMKLVTNLRKLIHEKEKENYEQNIQPATITFLFPDSVSITQDAEIRPRGDFRREICYMPPVKINFKTDKAAPLKKLGALKFVWPCENTSYHEQLVLKEYLIYKIYNLLTEKSFRVRLIKVEVSDINEKLKSHSYFGFFIEDVDDLAKRNNCFEIDSMKYYSEQTNRMQTTLATLFQYMIGNTDWGIPVYHNIKLIQSRDDSLTYPYVVPFDFDCSGLVNANYALPDMGLDITDVRQRAYRGFPRTMGELQAALLVLRNQREAIESLILNCKPLSGVNKKNMISYLEEFYKQAADEAKVRNLFIERARTQ